MMTPRLRTRCRASVPSAAPAVDQPPSKAKQTATTSSTRLGGCSKRLLVSPAQPRRAKTRRSAGKAAASEKTRRTLRYVELLSDARTPLVGLLSSLLDLMARSSMRNGHVDGGMFTLDCGAQR